jgi:uncharacterized protein YmfQ (DUF2313 family)
MSADFFTILRNLLPKGKLFRLVKENQWKQVLRGLAEEPDRICTFENEVRDAGLPGRIPDEALADWESDYNIETNASLTNTERNNRIISKISATGGQGPDYLEDVIQAAGFGLYVYENIPAVDPSTISGILIAGPSDWTVTIIWAVTSGGITMGGLTAIGSPVTMGGRAGSSIDPVDPSIPSDPNTWPFFWFLAGPANVNDTVNIDATREEELINLIISLKPAHTWVVANVAFV